MIIDRNKLNFVTIQWLWFLCLILVYSATAALAHNVETTQQQQSQQQQQQPTQTQAHIQTQSQQQSTLQLPRPQSQQQLLLKVESNGPPQQDVTVRNFSPRMDYNNNEWRPVGRGDPLKNDPTFDYSPPTLDRVRYWADPEKDKEKLEDAAIIDAKLKKANPGKNEILLLGVTGDRVRGSPMHQQHVHAQSMLKNAKGETPLLQPKYTSIRRSYYAHHLPTHLMPPPMQPMLSPTQQQQESQQHLQQSQPHLQQSQQQHLQQSQQQHIQQSQQHLQQSAAHIMKPVVHHTDYRNNMPMIAPPHSYMSSSPIAPAMNTHGKPYHMTTSSSTQPWIHSPSTSASMVTSMPSHHMKLSAMAPNYSHSHSYPHHDSHYQESMNYLTYTRPSMSSTPVAMAAHEYNSPNSIRGSSSMHKMSSSSRKPWIHDLLQKEFIKAVKPTLSPNSYHTESSSKPLHIDSHFEPMLPPYRGISTTFAPVSFVTPTTTPATTQAAIYITSSPAYYSTTPPPVFTQATTTQAPRTTTTLSPTRLLIPETSNMAYRPTVTPMKMTTDSLFSHYNQPERPLRGPMYLIIEGHSKVKTYGKDELDPHRPKIVPVISKREPVVRIADPNEKRGTPETFQVKHLHTKTTQAMEKPTTASPKITTTTNATTKKPAVSSTKSSTATPKSGTTTKKVTSTSTTIKPATTATKPVPKLILSTTSTTTTTLKPKLEKPYNKESKVPSKSLPMKEEKLSPNNLNALNIEQKPSQLLLSQPPTGMQGLFSLLDSSLDTLFRDDTTALGSNAEATEMKEGTTKLKPIMNTEPQIESRVSTKLHAIKAEDYDDDYDGSVMKSTTEYLPRETRQIFDYDQLPESRINVDKDNANYADLIDDEEEDFSALGFGDEYGDEDDDGTDSQKLIKRIDSLVSSTEDLEDFDDDALAELEEDDLDALDLARHQKSKQA